MKQIRFLSLLALFFLISACAPHAEMRRTDHGFRTTRSPHRIGGRPMKHLMLMASAFPADPLHNVEHFARDLELSKEQMERIRSVRGEFTRETIRLRSEIEIALLDLRDLTHRERSAINRDQIMKKVEEIGSLQITFTKKNVEAGLELANILNEEQFKKFAELLREESEMGRGGRGSRFSEENY